MKVKIKYFSISLNIILTIFVTNSDHFKLVQNDQIISGNLRLKRQDGYVYDRPTVSFDLPAATSIPTTQATTVDRIQMQMYYAYPVPAGGTGSNGQQNTGSSADSTGAVSSGSSGYNYGIQNTQVIDSQSNTLTESQNIGATGYQSSAVTGTSSYTGTQTSVSAGSKGYSSGRPTSGTNSGLIPGSVSTSAPRYLPPKSSSENTVGVSVSTGNQAQTGSRVTQPSGSYVPPSNQSPSPVNSQTVQSGVNAQSSSANLPNPAAGYLLPSPTGQQQIPILTSNPTSSVTPVQPQSRPQQPIPTQQYLPPIETSSGSETERPVSAPASTYLPPVF